VRQYESNQYGLIFVVNFGDEPVLIPGDVEDRTFQIRISVRERLPCFRKVSPSGSLGHSIPCIKRFFGVWVLLPELFQSLSTDNMQGKPFPPLSILGYQNGNKKSSLLSGRMRSQTPVHTENCIRYTKSFFLPKLRKNAPSTISILRDLDGDEFPDVLK